MTVYQSGSTPDRFVFSVGSIAFVGSLAIDSGIQVLVRNVLDEIVQADLGLARVPQQQTMVGSVLGITPSGHVVRIPPRGPKQDIVLGLFLESVAQEISDAEEARHLRRAIAEMIARRAAALERE